MELNDYFQVSEYQQYQEATIDDEEFDGEEGEGVEYEDQNLS